MTKLLATTIILLTLLVSTLMAEIKEGYFDCKLTKSYRVDLNNGVSKEYHGSKNEQELAPSVGASVKVN